MLLDKVVIGSTVESHLYAYLSDSYYIPTRPECPIFYEQLETNLLGSKRKDFTWSRLQTILALSGKLMNYEGLNYITVEEGSIKIISSSGNYSYLCDQCVIFDTTNVKVENEILKHREQEYIVYDDFEVSQLGGKHEYLKPKISPPGAAQKIVFYISDRVDGANYITDCVVESLLTEEQINSVDYSDSMVRFSVVRHLSDIGIHGNFMKFYKNGRPKYRKPKVTHKKRIVKNIYSSGNCKNAEDIVIAAMSKCV